MAAEEQSPFEGHVHDRRKVRRFVRAATVRRPTSSERRACASAAPTTDVDSDDGDQDGEDTNDLDLTVPDGDDPDAKLRQIVLGLTLINVVLETAGETLTSHSQIVALLQSDLCKFLLR